MKSIVTVSQGKTRFPLIVRAVEQGGMVAITRRRKPVAALVGYDWLDGVLESMELMANPEAMKAISDAKAGKLKFGRIEDIPE